MRTFTLTFSVHCDTTTVQSIYTYIYILVTTSKHYTQWHRWLLQISHASSILYCSYSTTLPCDAVLSPDFPWVLKIPANSRVHCIHSCLFQFALVLLLIVYADTDKVPRFISTHNHWRHSYFDENCPLNKDYITEILRYVN